jgi:hypothetical protein
MKTKTFKIGEYAIGGIIKVEIIGKIIKIKALDYFTKKEVSKGSVEATAENARYLIDKYLNNLTSYYYAEKIMEWIESKIVLV